MVNIAAVIGTILFDSMAGIAISINSFRLCLNSCHFGNDQSNNLSLTPSLYRPIAVEAITDNMVASAAPCMPNSGNGPMPKINRGLRMILSSVSSIEIYAEVAISPTALKVLVQTMVVINSGVAIIQTFMYSTINDNTTESAPIKWKILSNCK